MLGASLGLLLFIYLIHRAGPTKLLASIASLGWGLALVIAWGGVANILKTWAWRLTLVDAKYQVPFAGMLGLQLTSEAVGQFGGLASTTVAFPCRAFDSDIARQSPGDGIAIVTI